MGRKFAVRHAQTLVRPVLSPESECKRQKVNHSLLPEKDTNVSSFKSVPQRNSSNDYYYCVHLLLQIIPQIDWKGLGVKLKKKTDAELKAERDAEDKKSIVRK
jgi:hypothetical protein